MLTVAFGARSLSAKREAVCDAVLRLVCAFPAWLAFVAAIALVFAFVHPWRSEQQFRTLLWGSLAGSIVHAFVHEGFDVFAHSVGGPGVLQASLSAVSVVSFLAVVLLGPPSFVVGLVGTIALAIRGRRRPTPPPAPAA